MFSRQKCTLAFHKLVILYFRATQGTYPPSDSDLMVNWGISCEVGAVTLHCVVTPDVKENVRAADLTPDCIFKVGASLDNVLRALPTLYCPPLAASHMEGTVEWTCV